MALSREFLHRVLDGSDRSLQAAALRSVGAVAEPIYSAAMRARNIFYSRGIFKSHSLGRPTISVGNITTGGTGKTPVVGWLAGRLRDAGRHPAILLRGYRSSALGISDEQQVLDRTLNANSVHPIPVRANPDRIQSAAQLLREQPNIDSFVLDDAFQHRRARRDFDLVLVSAIDPFGYGHVLPRGLLREPVGGLIRADAFLITRSSQVSNGALAEIEATLARRNPRAPIYRSDHVLKSIRAGRTGERLLMDSLKTQHFYAICGIANPAALDLQLRSLGGEYVGHEWFADHHAYGADDVQRIQRDAKSAGAQQIITTEKDWVKIVALEAARENGIPIGVLEMNIEFHPDHEQRLLSQAVSVFT
jgi:tetraacyldisaccharide 4'-kinase